MKLTLFCLLIGLKASALSDTLNQKNLAGNKGGYWLIYLDENINPCDSSESFYFGYDLYDNGKKVWKYYRHTFKKDSLDKSSFHGIKGQPELLTGKFTWYRNGLLVSTEEYKGGHPHYFESISRSRTGEPGFHEHLYFYKRHLGVRGTYFFQQGYKDQGLSSFWFRKGKKGWKSYPINQ